MKNLSFIAALFALLLLASCNATKITTAWVAQHCTQTHYTNPRTGETQLNFECDSLYQNGKVKGTCKTAIVCFNIADANVKGELHCGDSTASLIDLLKSIVFKK